MNYRNRRVNREIQTILEAKSKSNIFLYRP